MKIGKLLVGAALTVAANSAIAAGPSPQAGIPEQGGWVLLESALSTAAAVITNSGCSLGIFALNVDVEANGSGTATLDGVTLTQPVPTTSSKGSLWRVTGGGSFRAVAVANYVGNYGSDREGAMLYGRADMLLGAGADAYDEHIIKDFWLKDPTAQNHADVVDDGLEIITKLDYPRTKWYQESAHHRPNGGDGTISVKKTQIAPDSTSLCSMSYTGLVDNLGGGWTTVGGVLMVTPLP